MKLYHVPEHINHIPVIHIIYGLQTTHNECSSRLPLIYASLVEHFGDKLLVFNSTREAKNDEILLCHDKDLLDFFEGAYGHLENHLSGHSEVVPYSFTNYTRQPSMPNKKFYIFAVAAHYCFDLITPIGKNTIRCARQSAAASVDAALQLNLTDNYTNVSYVLLRPPGHHAGRKFYGGFCYFNNSALAAQILLNRLKALSLQARVAIIDLDYHHGNGTQDIFYETNEIIFFSAHASPEYDYPYFSGSKEEIGEGKGKGFNFNYPFPMGATFDEHYKPTVNEIVSMLNTPEYKCSAIVVSLGFDALKGDPVGSFTLQPDDFGYFGEKIASLKIPTLIIQEGGYNPDRKQLARAAIAFSEPFVNP